MIIITPIDLPDTDGLRLVNVTPIRGYEAVTLSNPALIAVAVAEKRRRKLIADQNFRKFG